MASEPTVSIAKRLSDNFSAIIPLWAVSSRNREHYALQCGMLTLLLLLLAPPRAPPVNLNHRYSSSRIFCLFETAVCAVVVPQAISPLPFLGEVEPIDASRAINLAAKCQSGR